MTTNQTINGVPRAQLAAIADRIEHNYPNTAKELRALLDAHVEPIPDDYVPLDGMFRLEETEEGMTYWLKAGGYKSRL